MDTYSSKISNCTYKRQHSRQHSRRTVIPIWINSRLECWIRIHSEVKLLENFFWLTWKLSNFFHTSSLLARLITFWCELRTCKYYSEELQYTPYMRADFARIYAYSNDMSPLSSNSYTCIYSVFFPCNLRNMHKKHFIGQS